LYEEKLQFFEIILVKIDYSNLSQLNAMFLATPDPYFQMEDLSQATC